MKEGISHLPDLSAVLLAEGIITKPITAVVRKGKERFVCDARLAERQAKAISKGSRQKGSLRMAENVLDLDHIPGLSRYDRCRICVPQSCPRDCFLRLDCRYQQYLRDSMKPDIQICNHNYLLANASHRLEERPLLLRQYQALVVDEAHKLPDAARQMYTETLSAQDMDELCFLLQQAHFKNLSKRLRTAFLTLSISCTPSFAMPKRKISVPFSLTPFRQAALADCISLLQYAALTFDPARGSFASYARQVVQNGLVSYCRNLTGKQCRMISLAEMKPTALAALEVQHSAPFDIECETPLLLAAAESQYSGVTRKGVHALALQVSGIPLTAVATRMSAPPNHVSAWISRAVHKLRNDESFLSSLHEN